MFTMSRYHYFKKHAYTLVYENIIVTHLRFVGEGKNLDNVKRELDMSLL